MYAKISRYMASPLVTLLVLLSELFWAIDGKQADRQSALWYLITVAYNNSNIWGITYKASKLKTSRVIFQVHSDSAPAALQPLHDQAGDAVADERDLVRGALHQLHTHLLERLARRRRVWNEYGMFTSSSCFY